MSHKALKMVSLVLYIKNMLDFEVFDRVVKRDTLEHYLAQGIHTPKLSQSKGYISTQKLQ